ncbi:LysR family transcriptional regulator [Acetobacter nitrogenifigens DSM 23921 = NBRC 105050]|uniref:LysR family transcriptional regulator n=1 Tax=Acetobacter nitrogenifigens DSM 23921 = NBRC 105050 TaxID=1120919 RepID=A0A511X6M7_9PROT|nr:hydrogen peroxide-inducible genes activator [Acetobacter nitrogenifigens]GBQ98950.1 LysR family transcriptional regulator [Acetobacter nitrogenifigens DSM 23921 = NBRC 105050]GEN58597.1 LysR family transcriptional regulator [Acetobacter nitrogenifigens DSM 23921 = NBRC 105050]
MQALPSPQQLRYLIALAELRHFGRAAAACSVTQSTLSAGLLALERQMDAQLLDRDVGKRVVFTPLGDEVARRARVALDALEAIPLIAQAARAPMHGPMRMGVIPTIGPFLLPRLVPLLRERFPGMKLVLTEDVTERLLEKLSKGRLDVLLLAMPCMCDGLETIPIWRDPFIVAAPPGHPFAINMADVPLNRLQSEHMVLLEDGHCLREQTVDVCRQGGSWSGEESETAHTASSLHTLARMIGQGLGVGLLPRMAVDSGILNGTGVVTRSIEGGQAWRTIGVGWRAKSPRAADYHALAQALRALAPGDTSVSAEGDPAVASAAVGLEAAV